MIREWESLPRSSRSPPTRRAFLGSVVRAFVVVVVGQAAGVSPLPADLSNLSSEVGRRYLIAHPHEADRLSLEIMLGASVDSRAVRTRRVRRDFRVGDVVRIDGWVLARTEARLSALATLSDS